MAGVSSFRFGISESRIEFRDTFAVVPPDAEPPSFGLLPLKDTILKDLTLVKQGVPTLKK